MHAKWLAGCQWTGKSDLGKTAYVLSVVALAPLACLVYVGSPYRNHSRVRHPVLGPLLRLMDRPINRFIVDMASYTVFLFFLLMSIQKGISRKEGDPQVTEYVNVDGTEHFILNGKIQVLELHFDFYGDNLPSA